MVKEGLGRVQKARDDLLTWKPAEKEMKELERGGMDWKTQRETQAGQCNNQLLLSVTANTHYTVRMNNDSVG